MNKDRNIDIMGIVNLTDDSYFAQSRCAGPGQTIERVAQMIDEGASIIDIGACSTRPGAEIVSPEQEWERLSAVLPEIRKIFPEAVVSIDTFRSDVVRKAYDLVGGFIVNDISAGEADPEMLPTVGRLQLPYIAMHMRGDSLTMQSRTGYDNVTTEVVEYFHFDLVVIFIDEYDDISFFHVSYPPLSGMAGRALRLSPYVLIRR